MVHTIDSNYSSPKKQVQVLRKLRDTVKASNISATNGILESNIKELSFDRSSVCSASLRIDESNQIEDFPLLEAVTELMYLSLGQYKVVTDDLLSRWEYVIAQMITLNDDNFQTRAELKSLLKLSSIKLEVSINFSLLKIRLLSSCIIAKFKSHRRTKQQLKLLRIVITTLKMTILNA